MHNSHVSAKRLHPFKGFTTIITHKVFPLSVYCLVSVQSTRGDKCLPAYFTSVRPLARVCPDVSGKVGAVTETLFTDRATVGLLFTFLTNVVVIVVVVIGVEGQGRVLQTPFQTGRR